MEGNIFLQISTLLALTVSIAFLVRLLKQPLIIAYIVAGIVAGPMFFNLLHGGKDLYEIFAQFGVVLLLFVIGLNLNFNHLKSIGRISFITGAGQVIFTGVMGALILLAMNMSVTTSIYLAVAMTFSSTIIIMKFLTDKKDTETIYGKYTIGLMLVQDIIAVLILVVIGILRYEGGIMDSLGILILKIFFMIALVVVASKYLLPRILDRISHSSELLFIFTITWCFGISSLIYLSGFSVELGAIAAGLSLGSSPYQPEIGSRIKPLRDFFLVLFFVVLGSKMAFASVASVWFPGLILSLFILIGNPLILFLLFRSLKFTRRNSFLAGVTAAQVSEFGFVILFTGEQMGHLSGMELPIFTIVALSTIFISSYLITYSERIYNVLLPVFNVFGKDKHRQDNQVPVMYDAWVVGYHRIGRRVCETLQDMHVKFAVVDFDPSAIRHLRRQKTPSFFGDIGDVEFVQDLPLSNGKLLIMTLPSTDDQISLINHIRKSNGTTLIIANAAQYADMDILYEAGADYVMMPHLLGGNWIADVVRTKRWTAKTFSELKKDQQEQEHALGDAKRFA
ncbi:hypothetical protein A2524_01135 [Candidatus Wolfebacteria bacterium RIFOXYD12_FULL_48_21]|uniref:Uncharacterized protein n=1 Tax=Candidatus Wolfebacteria bacterium RIFOXYD1_FULL_48_65 TaxID=1802561 RepID=A0A1F8E0K7_9BACT|nr:MAG: hypothetical protein A2610_03080 [Candidatus Wolfebacteria bacterium RIFOXYD1_FULL_48_65]OGM94413.1 MAG: hypothetical protein A2524_01135 [Candidatus Wolfebacteria bacterium RIFOXYD12_FULL_48_21]OGM97606.1 MAG: hypothetical protein A2532_00050 [Candidatus Wolfebacteria bacterium RIFOXYD2_FULL_48_11]